MPHSRSNGSSGTADLTSGHRSRLLERFTKSGAEGLHDYEILELLLTYAIPRRDTKPVAKALLARFKNISAVLNTSPRELQEIEGIGERTAHLFSLIRETMAIALKEKFDRGEIISHRKDVEEYLRFHYGFRPYEYVATLFLDNGHHVLATELAGQGTANQCSIYPRHIIERALHHKASSIILAHNHPGGTVQASEADWRITKRLHQVGQLLDIPLLDHIVISRDRVISLREHPRWPK